MENNPQLERQDYYEDEIDLFELIHLLLKNKKLIALVTIGVTLLTILITAFVIKPVYQEDVEFKVSKYPTISTDYGEFTPSIKTNEDLAKLLQFTDSSDNDELMLNIMSKMDKYGLKVEDLEKVLVLSQDKNNPYLFKLAIKSNNLDFLEEAKELLAEEYIDFIDYSIQKEYIEYYKAYFKSEINDLQISLELRQGLLASAKERSAAANKFVEGTSELNPGWLKLETYIMDLTQDIRDAEINIALDQEKLEKLAKEEEDLSYPRTKSDFRSDLLERQEENLKVKKSKLNGTVIEGPQKVSPRLALNTAISFILGLMVAIFYVFAREWWKNSQKDIKGRWNQYK